MRRAGEDEQQTEIRFEQRRIFVAPRMSVLFLAWIGDEKIRCYVDADALIGPAPGLREQADRVQRCLLEFDDRRSAIESTAAHLIRTHQIDSDGVLTISRSLLGLETEPPLGALARANDSEGRDDLSTPKKPRARTG